jgi:hypothetical protein
MYTLRYTECRQVPPAQLCIHQGLVSHLTNVLQVFASAALFNHSCDPNVIRRVNDQGCLEVVARRAIQAGELLCLTYISLDGGGDDTTGMTGSGSGSASAGCGDCEGDARRKLLRECFFFECRCERCFGATAIRT